MDVSHPRRLYERSVIDQVYLQQLQFICKFIATPCQILGGDGLYICKSCHSKGLLNKRSLAMQLQRSYQVNGQQENYGYPNQRIQAISQARDSSCCKKNFVIKCYGKFVSHMTNSCIFKNLISNEKLNAASCRKCFRCLNLLIGQELLLYRCLLKNQRLKFMREFTTKEDLNTRKQVPIVLISLRPGFA